jgi:hypothetical protein
MNTGGPKPFSFLSGILLGMLAAIGLIFLLINDFNPLNLFSEKTEKLQSDTLVDLRERKVVGFKKGKKNSPKIQKDIESNSTDSFAIQNDSETVKNSLKDENIIVRRDELLESRFIDLIVLDGKKKNNKSDSLIQLLENNNPEKPQYKIEFWKSPINYKGFKMIKNNLIVFGLEVNEGSKLFSYEQQFYLKHGIAVYIIYQTSEFQALKRIYEESIIKLMR